MTDFLVLVPPILTLTAVLLLPGWALALALGRRGLWSLTLAPSLSVGTIVAAALVVDRLGLHWGFPPLLVVAALVVAGALLARRWTRPLDVVGTGTAGPEGPARWQGRSTIAALGGIVLGVALWSRHLKNVLMSPDALSQTFDNVFHLNVIRFIGQVGDPGPWIPAGLDVAATRTIFYPTAWHQLAALALPVTDGSVVHASNATLWVVCALVWPLSALELALTLGVRAPGALASVGALSASFSAYPFLMMDWGVLYPNLLAYAVVPASLAFLGPRLARGPGSDGARITPAFAAGFMLLGVAVSHPNALLLLLVLLLPAFAGGVLLAARALVHPGGAMRATLWLITSLLVLAVGAMTWLRMRPSNRPWPPLMSLETAVGQAALANPIIGPPGWVVAVVTAVGVVALAQKTHYAWYVGAGSVGLGLWLVAAAAPDGPLREFLTGIWYSDPYRLAPVLALLALPMAVVAMEMLLNRLGGWTGRSAVHAPTTAPSRRALRVGQRLSRGIVAAVLTPLLLVLGTQWSASIHHAVTHAATAYDAASVDCSDGDVTCLLTPDERILLEHLPSLVPADALLLAEPLNGSTLAYALAGRRVLRPYIGLKPTAAEEFLLTQLAHASPDDPQLCSALQETGITHVLDFGPETVHSGEVVHPGFQGLDTAPTARLVQRQGAASLYQVVACGQG